MVEMVSILVGRKLGFHHHQDVDGTLEVDCCGHAAVVDKLADIVVVDSEDKIQVEVDDDGNEVEVGADDEDDDAGVGGDRKDYLVVLVQDQKKSKLPVGVEVVGVVVGVDAE
jgi:hypothetical protein